MISEGSPLTMHEIFAGMEKKVLYVYLKKIASIQQIQKTLFPSKEISIEEAVSLLQDSDPLPMMNRSRYFEEFRVFLDYLSESGYTVKRSVLEKRFSKDKVERILSMLEPAFVVFPLSDNKGQNYVCIPLDYLFTTRFHLDAPYRTSLGVLLRYYNKTMISPIMMTLGIEAHSRDSNYTLKANILAHIIRNKELILKLLNPDERKVLAFLKKMNGIASVDDIAQFIKAELGISIGVRSGDDKEKLFTNTSNKSDILSILAKKGIVAVVLNYDNRFLKGFVIPSEYYQSILLNEYHSKEDSLSSPISTVPIQSKLTILQRMQAFMFVVARLSLTSKRKSLQKIAVLLGLPEGLVTQLLSIARHLHFITGPPTTFTVTKEGIIALSNKENMLSSIGKYLDYLIGKAGFQHSSDDLLKHVITEYSIQMVAEEKYPIQASRILAQIESDMTINEIMRLRDLDLLTGYTYYSGGRTNELRSNANEEPNHETVIQVLNQLRFLDVLSTNSDIIGPESIISAGALMPLLLNENEKLGSILEKVENTEPILQVKPDFEIIASFNLRWDILRYLIGAAELISADRIYLCRITEQSLSMFSNHSGSIPDFLNTLKKESSTGVPKNVEQLFLDIERKIGELTFIRCSGVLVSKDKFIIDRLKEESALKNIQFTDIADNISVVIDREDAEDVLNTLYKRNYLFSSNVDEVEDE